MTDHEQPAAGVALKPCPVCSSPPDEGPERVGGPAHHVYCGKAECWVDGPLAPSREQAIAAWNTRAPTDAGGAVSEAMVDAAVAVTGDGRAITRRALEAALTPAPQAEGEALIPEEVEAWLSERGLMPRGQYDGAQIATMLTEHEAALSSPHPLQQGGEVTRAAGEKANAIMNSFHPQWSKDHEGEAALGWFIDNLASLAADRDKAFGLLRQFHTRIMMERRCGGLAVNVAQPIMEATDAFLSSQTEGR